MSLSPGYAALCSMLVPGLAHVLMGRLVRGVVAFALTIGLFGIGYSIIRDRIWFFELVTPSGWLGFLRYFPIQLLPESPNFGASTLVAWLRGSDTHEALRLLRLPREMENLGSLLTGLSGVISCLWATDAYWLARGMRAPKLSPALAAAATWILPGSGHVLAGQKSKGVVTGAAVLAMFVLGLAFSEGHGVDRAMLPAWWIGESLCGVGVVFGSLLTAPLRMSEVPAFYDLGYILCTVSGLMNLILMTDAYTVAEQGAAALATGSADAREVTA